MKERNVIMKPAEIIHIKYNEFTMSISPGARNSFYISGIERIGFDDERATYIDVPNRFKAILNENRGVE